MSDRREWTAERHAAATARCDAATKGPWATYDGGWREHERAAVNPWRFMFVVVPLDGPPKYPGHVVTKFVAELKDAQAMRAEVDAAFIAHARVDLPDALREIERLSDALACDRAILKARTDALDTAETCRESLRKGLEQASEQIAEMTAEAKVATAEIEQLRDTVHNYKALLAAAESAGREVCDERDEARAEVSRLKADLLLLGALKSEEVAPVIARFREAFGADVPQAPSGTTAIPDWYIERTKDWPPDHPKPPPYDVAPWEHVSGTWYRTAFAPFEDYAAHVWILGDGRSGRVGVRVRNKDGRSIKCEAARPDVGRAIADVLLRGFGWPV